MRTQPFDQRALQGVGVFRHIGEQLRRQLRTRILDDLRHLLHEDRQALASAAQEGDEAETCGHQCGDDGRGDQRHGEHARSIAAEPAHAQPRRQHVDQFVSEQPGEQRRQQVERDYEAERECAQAPADDVGARDRVGGDGSHAMGR